MESPTGVRASIKVFCEDTDVFALLCHCFHLQNWATDLHMSEFSERRTITSIRDTAKNHMQLIPGLLSAHALTGCDTLPMMHGIGKKKAINITKKSSLFYLGQRHATEEQYQSQSKQFIAECYVAKYESSTKNR